jgi:ribonuclease BN (tRNA processing enzyme)
MGRLARLGIGPEHIDALFLTHFHPDHITDLIAFLFANNYGQPSRTADLTIAAAVGFKNFHKSLRASFEHWLDPQNYNLRVIELTEDPIELQGIQVQNKRVQHSPVSLAYRFTNRKGKSIVISGDTDYCPELVDLARHADLAVLECSFPDALKVDGHLSPCYAGKIAREAECKQLVLTHFYPPCDDVDILDECRKEFSRKIFLAEDFWEYNLDI